MMRLFPFVLPFIVLSIQANSDQELLQAAFSNNLDGVKDALRAGANPLATDPSSGQSALMGAVLRGHLPIVKHMLSLSNADEVSKIAERDGYTPAHGAGFQGRADIMLLLHRAGVNVKDDFHADGYAPLHRACWGREERHTETLRVLKEEVGVDLGMLSKDGKSCIEMTHNPSTKRLLQGGQTEL